MGKNKKGKPKPKQKGRGSRRNTGKSRGSGFMGIPQGGSRTSSARSDLFTPLLLNAVTAASMQSPTLDKRLYRPMNVLDFGTLGSNNKVQYWLVEPLIDAWFTSTGGDKLDTTSKQDLIDAIFKSTEFLYDLRLLWQYVYFMPTITRDDTNYIYGPTIAGWESAMQALSKLNIRIPVLALNLARLLTLVFQVSPGNAQIRARPSYWLMGTPGRSLAGNAAPGRSSGTLYDQALSIMSEWDSKIFETQAKIPTVPFSRSMIEEVQVFHPHSNLGMSIMRNMPMKIQQTIHFLPFDNNTTIDWYPEFGPIPDWYALAVFINAYEPTNANNMTIWDLTDRSASDISVQIADIQAFNGWADMTVANTIVPPFDNMGLMSIFSMNETLPQIWHHEIRIYNALPSYQAWVERCISAMLTMNIMGSSGIRIEYRGLVPTKDLLTNPPSEVADRSHGLVDYFYNVWAPSSGLHPPSGMSGADIASFFSSIPNSPAGGESQAYTERKRSQINPALPR